MATKIIVENKDQFEEAEKILNQFSEGYQKYIESIEKKMGIIREIVLSTQWKDKIEFVIPKNVYSVTVSPDLAFCYGKGFSIKQPKDEKKTVEVQFMEMELKTGNDLIEKKLEDVGE